jgi:hypothetical protein
MITSSFASNYLQQLNQFGHKYDRKGENTSLNEIAMCLEVLYQNSREEMYETN